MDLRYPIGPFKLDTTQSEEHIQRAIQEISEAPAKLRTAVSGLSPQQLDTPYRPDGWTIRQVVHHVPDSHLNSYCRFKLALTEDEPTIKPYNEKRWAELEDSRVTPIEVSLALIESLHERWVLLLKSLEATDFRRTFRHPDVGVLSLGQTACLYSWHGRHHTAHVTSLRERMGW